VAVFHVLAALALIIFSVGVIRRVRFWLGASPADIGSSNNWSEALALSGRGLAVFLRSQTLRALFLDGLLLRRLWRENRLRWLIHLSIAWSFVGLFVIGSLGNMASDLGAPLEKDDAWFATTNESLGLALLAGLALALGRRYISPKPYTKTLFEDAAALAVLVLLGMGGFFLEASRFLKEGTPASVGGYAFLGYPLSQAIKPLGWDWAAVYDWLWWTHSLLALGLVAYLPFSKLFHMFASPLTIALNAGAADPPGEAVRAVEGGARVWPA